MKHKRILTLLLAALLLLPAPALAAAGDANFLRGDEPFQSLGGFPDGGCAVGGTLYLYTPTHLYVWRPGDAAPMPIAYEIPTRDEGERVEIARLFADGARLCALCAAYAYEDEDGPGLTRLEIAEVEIDGGEARFGAPTELDDADGLSVYYGDAAELAQLCGAAVAGGRLFLDYYGDAGGRALCMVDLADGGTEYFEVENLAWIAACDGERLLAETYDRASKELRLQLYDPEADEWTPARAPLQAEAALTGLAWSAESGRLFYLADGYVMAAEGFDIEGAQPAAELVARYPELSAACLLPGDRYAYIGARDCVCVRATGPDALPDKQIVVEGGGLFGAMMDGYYKFNARHDDAAVVMREDFSDDDAILTSIVSRDDAVDVRVMMTSGALYEALRQRGYLAALDSAALAEAVGGMYPAIREALTLGGAVVAVPVYASCWALALDYEGFEKLGIPREKVPDNWPDFLDLLPTLPEQLPEDGSVRIFPEYSTQTQVRTELINEILANWQLRPRAEGQEISYDSPELCAALEKAMALDLDALGVAKGGGDEYEMISVSGGYASGAGRDYTLVTTNADCSISGMGYSEPALLSVIPGEEAPLPLDLAVLCVNPASKHIDLAQEYLACVYESLDEDALYMLSDRYSEPVPSPSYARNLQQAEQEIATIQEKLADPELEDRELWEETLKQWEGQREAIEANRWRISPEKIAWYRAHGARLTVKDRHYVSVAESDGEYSDLTQQFLSGRLDAQHFLQELDRRATMRSHETT